MSYNFFYSGPLVARQTSFDFQHRAINGFLKSPPLLYVISYDEKYNQMRGIETPWEAGEVLAPKHVEKLYEAIREARDIQWKVVEANMKAEVRDAV